MDRNSTNQAQVQVAFMDFIVRPYFESLAEVFPRMLSFADIIHENSREWESMLTPMSPTADELDEENDVATDM
ncbi:hypothetical protein BC831DRAFT_381443, partial [Entophlyctis helioformis]